MAGCRKMTKVTAILLCYVARISAVVYDRANGGFTSVPVDIGVDATEIDLSGNDITTISNTDFSSFTALRVLNLRNNSITTIFNDSFSSNALEELYLDGNDLTQFPAFSGVDGSLRVLDLSGNNITTVPGYFLYTSVTHLDLSDNPFVLPQGGTDGIIVFVGLLEVLDLSNTVCTSGGQTVDLSDLFFERITHLTIRRCSLNAVPATHEYNSVLEEINFSSNGLTAGDIEASALNSYVTVLHRLYLRHNSIARIPSMNNDIRSTLLTMHLSYNTITSITFATLEDYTALEYLGLEGNSITAFEQVPQLLALTEIDLAQNSISSVEEAVIANLTSLERLRLNANNLAVFPNISGFAPAHHLMLYLHNNVFVCNCSFSFILEVAHAHYSNLSVELELTPCVSPSAHVTSPYTSLTEDDLCESIVECDPFPAWLNIELDSGEVVQPGGRVRYACQSGYAFNDESESKTSRCDADDGSWNPSFKWCYEKVSQHDIAEFEKPAESKNAEVIGSIAVIAVLAEIAFVILLDSNHWKRQCRRCARCRGNGKKETPVKPHVGPRLLHVAVASTSGMHPVTHRPRPSMATGHTGNSAGKATHTLKPHQSMEFC